MAITTRNVGQRGMARGKRGGGANASMRGQGRGTTRSNPIVERGVGRGGQAHGHGGQARGRGVQARGRGIPRGGA